MEDGKHAFSMAYCLNLSLICRYSVKEKCFLYIIKSFFHIHFTKMKRLQLFAALIFTFFVIDWSGL